MISERLIPATEIEYLTAIRRDLHAHPELGFEEERTNHVVQRELAKVGINFQAGLAKGTGVLGYLPATVNPEKAQTIALRADMDALPIFEKSGVSYQSNFPHKMHACGHDGHTSILIGTARRLAEIADRPNNILFLFQPAEEGGGGGNEMCKDGALTGALIGNKVDRIFGLHCSPINKIGAVATRKGPIMASADSFQLFVRGKGGHAAHPDSGIDPIVVTAHIITALQTIASRNVSPLDSVVVTIGKIDGGTASNIIPDEVHMLGTLRTLNNEVRKLGMDRIEKIIAQVAEAFGATARIEWDMGYPVTVNDSEMVDHLRRILKPVKGDLLIDEDTPITMGAEDFSFYGHHVPACFYWLGLLREGQETYPNLHAPEFDFNDDAIAYGIEAMTALALGTY